jgi:hypothetical protein
VKVNDFPPRTKKMMINDINLLQRDMDRKQKINLVLCTFDHHIIIIKQQQTAPIKKQSDELIKVCFSGPLCKKKQ